MPMAPGQPLFLMWSGVNRITANGNLRAPEQRVSRLGALEAVTLGAAYSLRLEKDVGSIVSGKLANFTILGDNPVTCDPMKIKDIAVWGTVQEGRVLPVRPSPATASGAVLDGMRAGAGASARPGVDDAMLADQIAGRLQALLSHGH
jgi:hypothetical protein